MIVELGPALATVRDADDCTRLSVVTGLAGAELEAALAGTGLGKRQDDVVLLDLGVLHDRARAASSVPDWESRWTAMIDYAARKGWLSADGSAVQAHLESAS